MRGRRRRDPGFIRELEHLSYVEALERLAQQAGVHLRYEGDSPERQAGGGQGRTALFRATEQAAELYARMLATKARKPAMPAGVRDRTGPSRPSRVAAIGIGYSPGYADFLLSADSPRPVT